MSIIITVYILIALCVWIWAGMALHEKWTVNTLFDHIAVSYVAACIGACWLLILPFLLIGMFTAWLNEKR